MGFLHKLWDETLAGPAPEIGLGRLRKYDSFSAARSPLPPPPAKDDQISVTRSITILKRNSNNNAGFRNSALDPGSDPGSPLGSSEPGTPSTPGTPPGDFRRFSRAKRSPEDGTTSSDSYHWILISSLDR